MRIRIRNTARQYINLASYFDTIGTTEQLKPIDDGVKHIYVAVQGFEDIFRGLLNLKEITFTPRCH